MISRITEGWTWSLYERNRRPILLTTVSIAVLLTVARLAPFAVVGRILALVFLLAPAALVLVSALARRPELGFPLMVLVALFVPFSIGTGTETGINAAVLFTALLIALWLLEMVSVERRIRLIASPVILPLLAFVLVAVLSLGFGQVRWYPLPPATLAAQVGGMAILLLSPGVFLLAAHRLNRVEPLKWMTWLFVGFGALFVVTLLLPGGAEFGMDLFQRAVLEAMFWTWLVTLSFSQALLNRKLAIGPRLLLFAIAASAFYYTIGIRQYWISGWLPATVAISVIVLIWKPKLALAGLVILAAWFALQPQSVRAIFLSGDNENSLLTRIEAWKVLFEMIKLNPLFGLGPANYYRYTPMYSILGYEVNFNSHNNYMDLIAQTGFLGLACFLWFAVAMGKASWRLWDRMPEGFPRAYVVGAFGGLIAMLIAAMLGDWVLPFVYNVGLEGFRSAGLAWAFLGAVLALERIYSSGAEQTPVAPGA